jgi:hypothetical protein
MRDPDLVFRAQLAAAALEGAWHRWRVVHGLAADPMPTVSSYVGYSLEEPWGQPRVVFGLAAEDAEQLATLLERHDCVGPVYAAVATQSGARDLSPRPGARTGPVPVPRPGPGPGPGQGSSGLAEPREWLRPDMMPPDELSALLDQEEQGGDYGEPVFRQAAAAMADAAAIADAAVAKDRADTGHGTDSPGGAVDPDTARADSIVVDGLLEQADSTLTADGKASMGSLTRAASAARAEAEARIRAALTEYRSSVSNECSYPDPSYADPVYPEPSYPGTNLVMPEIQATDVLEPLPRPEVASGAFTSGAFTPGTFTPGTDDDAETQAAGDQEFDPLTPGTPDVSAQGTVRRSRAPRGYPIPRLSRTKRPGAVPGA